MLQLKPVIIEEIEVWGDRSIHESPQDLRANPVGVRQL